MTASTVKSTKVTNALDSSPRVMQDSRKLSGHLSIWTDTTEAATTSTDEQDDVILMLPVPSHVSLHSLRLFNDDLDSGGTSGAVNVGLYNGPEAFNDTDASKTAYAAYAVIDADCFASAITSLTAANKTGEEIRYEAAGTANEIANVGNPLWQIAGLTSDPGRTFVVGITVTTAMTTPVAGTITLVGLGVD